MPAFARWGMTMGTSPTRRSPGYVSRGTPTIIRLSPFDSNVVAHMQIQQSGKHNQNCPRQGREFSSRGPRQVRMASMWHPEQALSRRLLVVFAARPVTLLSVEPHTEAPILHGIFRKSNRRSSGSDLIIECVK